MVEDLLNSGLLIGRPEKDILTMLGPPDTEQGPRWDYTVDIVHDFVSSPWLYDLQVFFSNSGHVESAAIMD